MEFKETLRIANKCDEEKAKQEHFRTSKEKYETLYCQKDVQEYLHIIVSTLMLEQNKRFEDFKVYTKYRFKSPRSIEHKIKENLLESKTGYDENQKYFIQSPPIRDVFAMNIIAQNSPSAYYSTDPEIRELIAEKKLNNEFLEQEQEFRSKLIMSEYENPPTYKFEVTKLEYLTHCKEILGRTKKLFSPKATVLLESLDEKIDRINQNIELLQSINQQNELVDERFLTNNDAKFLNILKDYEHAMHNKLDLAVLTKQIKSLFNNNTIFEQLGISLNDSLSREKRTKIGYESNFIYFDTIVGTIECQLQTEEQNRQGNYGYAAHCNMDGKHITPLPIPNIENPKEIEQFCNFVEYVSPQYFSAKLDDNEANRVLIQKYGNYQNYKIVAGQLRDDDPRKEVIYDHFDKLYKCKDKIFKADERLFGFTGQDIQEYIHNNNLKSFKETYLEER